MGKKHKHPEHENLERWLVSYADFITLLFATFTALYAMASSDLSRMRDVGQAIQEGFQQQSLFNGLKSIMQGKSEPQENPSMMSKKQGEGAGVVGKYESLSYTPGEVKKFDQVVHALKADVETINKEIKKHIRVLGSEGHGLEKNPDKEAGGISLSVQERGIKISIDSSLLFEPGSAALKAEALKALDIVAERLKALAADHLVQVEGHTDNMPIVTAIYPSNWELSAARSSSVVRYLIQQHQYVPDRLSVVGFGDSRPAESNATPEGRQKNRRIDIILYNRIDGNRTDPAYQQRNETAVVKADQETPGQQSSLPDSHVKPDPKLEKSEEYDPDKEKTILSDGPVRVILKTHSGTKIIDPVSSSGAPAKALTLPGIKPALQKPIQEKSIESP